MWLKFKKGLLREYGMGCRGVTILKALRVIVGLSGLGSITFPYITCLSTRS